MITEVAVCTKQLQNKFISSFPEYNRWQAELPLDMAHLRYVHSGLALAVNIHII